MRRLVYAALAAIALITITAMASASGSGKYDVKVALASADNLVSGGWVTVNGFHAGRISSIGVRDGKALIGLSLDHKYAPLHDGATVQVEWKALLGERWLEISDGPSGNATIPGGGLIRGDQPAPVNIDQALAALDAPTRAHLASTIQELKSTLSGNEKDVRSSLIASGPALASLGQVLKALDTDGPAIKNLVSQLDQLVGVLARRDQNVRTIVDSLSSTTADLVSQRSQLSSLLGQLPATLDIASKTLRDVPGTTDKAVPLLRKLKPATDQLPTVAKHLTPVLTDLRPTVQRLQPTLLAANTLLAYTPGLLDTAHATLPQAAATTKYLGPVLDYLRPYTPELAGWMAGWAGNAANYDGNGHFVRFYPQAGATAFGNSPAIVPPGFVWDPYPKPGAVGNQAWTDAWGGGNR